MIPVIFGWRPREPVTYDLVPVAQRMPGWVRDPHGPDPVVFGPEGAAEHRVRWNDGWDGEPVRSCPCGVKWCGDGPCWACEP